MSDSTITIPKRRIVRIGNSSKPSRDDLWFVVEKNDDGTWGEISKGYPHSTSAFAVLGRITQKELPEEERRSR